MIDTYYIGGSSCAGKSTVAEMLSQKYDLYYFKVDDFEKQAATASDFDWIVTALKGLASAYANKSLQQTLEKINSLQLKENNTVSLDLGAANEDGKINEQLKLLEGAIEKKYIVQFSIRTAMAREKRFRQSQSVSNTNGITGI